jgi:small conductance mechanosensitive channel
MLFQSDPAATPPSDVSTTEAVQALAERAVSLDFWLGLGIVAFKVALIVLLATLGVRLIVRLTKRWEARVADLPPLDPKRQRVITVANLLRSTGRFVLYLMAVLMALETVGLAIGPLLAGAGIAGLAIGFGAQTLVKDVISGVFLLLDDSIHVGDLVRIGPNTGTVEHVGLRILRVRKFDGELVIVPAGELRTFGNKSVGFARVIVEVGLSYEADADEVLGALKDVAAEWAAVEENRAIMLEPEPQVQAFMALGDSAVTARIVCQVTPGAQFLAERDLRLLIKRRFDERGVEIPFPRRTVYVRREEANGASAPTEPGLEPAA